MMNLAKSIIIFSLAMGMMTISASAAYIQGQVGQIQNLVSKSHYKTYVNLTYFRQNKFNASDCNDIFAGRKNDTYYRSRQFISIPVKQDGRVILKEKMGGDPSWNEFECWRASVMVRNAQDQFADEIFYAPRTTVSNSDDSRGKNTLSWTMSWLNSNKIVYVTPAINLNFKTTENTDRDSIAAFTFRLQSLVEQRQSDIASIGNYYAVPKDLGSFKIPPLVSVAHTMTSISFKLSTLLLAKTQNSRFESKCKQLSAVNFPITKLPASLDQTILLECTK